MPILEAQDLTRHYSVGGGAFKKAATVKALQGASFTLDAGETLAVVGESGCGKSTLARVLTLIEPPTSGALSIDGALMHGVRANAELRRKVQIVFQNPYGSLNPRKTVAKTLEEPLLLNTDMPKAERREAVLSMLDKVGLRREHADRYPHMFSGGQRQRVAVNEVDLKLGRAAFLNDGVDRQALRFGVIVDMFDDGFEFIDRRD